MNDCPLGGYLVSGKMPLPSEPVDHDVEDLPRLGCNRLRCQACKAVVRSAAGLSLRDSNEKLDAAQLHDVSDLSTSPLLIPVSGFRLYLCRCSRHVQKNAEDALADPDPDCTTPNVPWRCEGHPIAQLPGDLDGVMVTAENLAELITRSLHGWTPPAAHPASKLGASWATRMHVRFAKTPWADVAVSAAAAALEDPDPQARARALHFFYFLPLAVGVHRGLELLEGERRLFAGVPYEIPGVTGDKTLEEALWRLSAPLVSSPGRARDLARAEALAPGKGSAALFAALASGDPGWVEEHVEEIGRANPEQVKTLGDVIRLRMRAAAKPLLAKLNALAESSGR